MSIHIFARYVLLLWWWLQGAWPPAFAITPVNPTLGTEYMFVGLGCGVLGVFSLATGK
jgi:hypothetical protein